MQHEHKEGGRDRHTIFRFKLIAEHEDEAYNIQIKSRVACTRVHTIFRAKAKHEQ